jgi:hypothetical protein
VVDLLVTEIREDADGGRVSLYHHGQHYLVSEEAVIGAGTDRRIGADGRSRGRPFPRNHANISAIAERENTRPLVVQPRRGQLRPSTLSEALNKPRSAAGGPDCHDHRAT